jgi:hypothetical protein
MTYYLTWKPWTKRTEPFVIILGRRRGIRLDPKVLHIALRPVPQPCSRWLTMAIIVGILGFMMDERQVARTTPRVLQRLLSIRSTCRSYSSARRSP